MGQSMLEPCTAASFRFGWRVVADMSFATSLGFVRQGVPGTVTLITIYGIVTLNSAETPVCGKRLQLLL